MNKSRNSWRCDVSFSESEKHRLWAFIKMELDLFNHLNESMITQLRHGNFRSFLSLSRKLHIFGEVSEHNLDLRQIIKSKDIPECLDSVKDDLIFLKDEELRILDIPAFKTQLSPRTKRNLSVQMFKYYCQQAAAFTDSGEYKFAPKFIESSDITRKRHLQLHRKAVIVENVTDDDGKISTLIKSPYLENKIVLKDNVKSFKWDLMVIHQLPGNHINPQSPWFIDFKRSDDDYMLQYLDFQYNPHRAFNQSKNDYRKTSF